MFRTILRKIFKVKTPHIDCPWCERSLTVPFRDAVSSHPEIILRIHAQYCPKYPWNRPSDFRATTPVRHAGLFPWQSHYTPVQTDLRSFILRGRHSR